MKRFLLLLALDACFVDARTEQEKTQGLTGYIIIAGDDTVNGVRCYTTQGASGAPSCVHLKASVAVVGVSKSLPERP